jgi:3,4-dihydroxy 2-butanone 4-phosphate synthase/GTP cyclohydrolase II
MNASVTPRRPRAAASPRSRRSSPSIRAGRMVILVDEEDRENEGDLVLAADHVTPEAINFMARFGRGLICLTLSRERCERLQLPPMVARNGTKMGTAFTVSIEAAEGVTTGISAADRARTVQAAVARDAVAADLVQPGHIFPLQAVDGGVLMRAGHTEAGCDLAAMAGLTPAAVICEVMKDDGTMARLPDLQLFAAEHGLKIGTIADLIEHRSRNESLVEKIGSRPLQTQLGAFTAHAWRDKPSRACTWRWCGHLGARRHVPVRVHEPLSVLDALETTAPALLEPGRQPASTSREGKGVAVLLNCGETADQLLAQFEGTARAAQAPERGRMDLRTYGVGAQILRECGVHRMNLLGTPRRMPSMAGYGLEIAGYLAPPNPERTSCLVQTRARPTGWTARACASASCRPASTSPSPTRWPSLQGRAAALGVAANDIEHVLVPGALEVPVALQALAEKAATTRWWRWAASSAARPTTSSWWPTSRRGVTRVALDYQLPIANAILTTENLEQAVARQTDKGRDAARVAVEMANLLDPS